MVKGLKALGGSHRPRLRTLHGLGFRGLGFKV